MATIVHTKPISSPSSRNVTRHPGSSGYLPPSNSEVILGVSQADTKKATPDFPRRVAFIRLQLAALDLRMLACRLGTGADPADAQVPPRREGQTGFKRE